MRKLAFSGKSPKFRPFDICTDQESFAPKKLRLLLLARSLDRGGTERQLVLLACGLRARGWDVSVAQFYAGGPFEEELRFAGVKLHDLRKHGRWNIASFLFRLGGVLRSEQPTILHGYLPVPNLLATLLRPLLPNTRIVWGVRTSQMDLRHYDWFAKLAFFLTCKIARIADLIIANSSAGKDYHVACGYPAHKMIVIPNGVDTQRFQFDSVGRQQLRAQWRVSAEEVLIGLVGRLDPMKDHSTFLRAAALLVQKDAHCRFVCVGDGPPEYAGRLREEARALGLNERLIWVGGRDDMAAVYSTFDIACSSSCSEGSSNVVIEAMACGRPCVVTDVGDSAAVVGDTGYVVPPNDAVVLSKVLGDLLQLGPDAQSRLGSRAQMRVVKQFSVERMLSATGQALESLWTYNH